MNNMLQRLWDFLKERVAAGDIYVWGGSGKLAAAITEAWIRAKEADCNGGSYADRAVKTWRKRVASGLSAFRAYDCSGLVSAGLKLLGIIVDRLNCDGLWDLCDQIDQIETIKKTILGKAFRGELGTNVVGEASAVALLKQALQD